MPRKIYRIEHLEHGGGPYMSGDYRDTRFIDSWPERPGPNTDPGLRGIGPLHAFSRFGFTSRAQLKRWFTPARRKALIAMGYAMAVYEADAVIASKRQAVFDILSARKIAMGELTNV